MRWLERYQSHVGGRWDELPRKDTSAVKPIQLMNETVDGALPDLQIQRRRLRT